MHTLVQKHAPVWNHFAGHLGSIVGRPLNLDGQGLAQHVLDWFVWLTSFLVKLNPLGIPAKGRIFKCGEQFGFFSAELNESLEFIDFNESEGG